MSLRVVQHGTEGAPVVALWFCDTRPNGHGGDASTEARARMLCDVLPDLHVVASHERDLRSAEAVMAELRALVPGVEHLPLVACGWSAGVQTVRTLATAGLLTGAVVLDGTSGAVPPTEAQLAPWRTLAERARRGEALFVGTCTQQSYTETDLPVGQRYAWTRHVLERACGVELPAGAEIHDGSLHLYSVPSAKYDGAAHIAQITQWLPRLLRVHVAPWLGGGREHPDEADTQPSPLPPWRDYHVSLGTRLVRWMHAEKDAGVHDDGKNGGERVAQYLARALRRGTEAPLGITAAAWCGAMVGYGLVECAWPGEAYPTPRASGFEYEQGAKATGDWVPIADVLSGVYEPAEGDLVICDRSRGPGAQDWWRHVCAWQRRDGERVLTIGGNESDRVLETWRRLDGRGEAEPILGLVSLRQRAAADLSHGPLPTVALEEVA